MKWIKFDLHHHTGEDKDRSSKDFDHKKILENFHKNDVKLIAITNHNRISKISINNYKKIIIKNNYKIKILPGIELEFIMKGSSKKGHLILIFSDEYDIESLGKFFETHYNSNSPKNFTEYFPRIINFLNSKGFTKFIVMPHFDKPSNPIDYETIGDYYLKPWLTSFDILEGKIANPNAIARIEKSLKMAKYEPNIAIYIGTDAQNTNECIENLSKISYVLTEPSFQGLIKMVNFSKTRISKETKNKPFLLDKYIESVEINHNTLNFEVGLNSIIGRRGSGKSFLVNSIIMNLKPTSQRKLKGTNNIKLNGSFDKDKIIYFEQSKLSLTLSEFVNRIASEKQRDFDLIKYVFPDFDRFNFCDSIVEFHQAQNKIKKLVNKILKEEYEIKNLGLQKDSKVLRNDILRKFSDNISKALNKDAIEKVKNDFNEIKAILKKRTISEWLRLELSKIISKIESWKENSKYQKNEILSKIYLDISDILVSKISSIEEKKYSDLSNWLDQLKKTKISEKYKELNDFLNVIINFHNDVKNGIKFIEKDLSVENDSLDFLSFDNKIEKINDVKSEEDTIYKFIKFNLKDDFTKKSRVASKDTILQLIKITIIAKIDGVDISDLSIGTKHEKFMESILRIKNADIIILDQPDDDLDAMTIQKNLIERFTKYFNDKQWIVVTHDPKIVINSDSRKIIMSNYDKSFDENKPFYYEVSENELKQNVYKILDSKKEFPEIRAKKYQEDVNENK